MNILSNGRGSDVICVNAAEKMLTNCIVLQPLQYQDHYEAAKHIPRMFGSELDILMEAAREVWEK